MKKLLFIIMAYFHSVLLLNSAGWDTTSFPNGPGDSTKHYTAITSYNLDVYVALYYPPVNGYDGHTDIFKWNSSSGWGSYTPITQVDNRISEMIAHGGYLYVAGSFNTVGSGTSAKNIARYKISDGTWQALGSSTTGVNGSILKLAYDNYSGYVYMGGEFSNVCGVTAKYLARWNGSSWSQVSTALTDPADGVFTPGVKDIDIYNSQHYVYPTGYISRSQVVVGGNFVCSSSHDIAVFDSFLNSWVVFGTGLRDADLINCSPCDYQYGIDDRGDSVYSCKMLNGTGKVVVAGNFKSINNIKYGHLPAPTPDPGCLCVYPDSRGWDAKIQLADTYYGYSNATLNKWEHSNLEITGQIAKRGSNIYAFITDLTTLDSYFYRINSDESFTSLSSSPPIDVPSHAASNSSGVYFINLTTLARWIP